APAYRNHVRTPDRRLPAPGPGKRKKSKKPLRGGVCLLTKGVLISVRWSPTSGQADKTRSIAVWCAFPSARTTYPNRLPVHLGPCSAPLLPSQDVRDRLRL